MDRHQQDRRRLITGFVAYVAVLAILTAIGVWQAFAYKRAIARQMAESARLEAASRALFERMKSVRFSKADFERALPDPRPVMVRRHYHRGDSPCDLVVYRDPQTGAELNCHFEVNQRGGSFGAGQPTVPLIRPPGMRQAAWIREHVDYVAPWLWVAALILSVALPNVHHRRQFALAAVALALTWLASQVRDPLDQFLWRDQTTFAALQLLAGVVVAFLAFRAQTRRDPRLCEVCGYDLRATPDRCPECGTVPAGASSP